MLDPTGAVAAALIALLRASAGVKAVTGSLPAIGGTAAQPTKAKVFDATPSGIERPYVNLGSSRQTIPVRFDETNGGADVNVTIHGWTNGPSTVKSEQLGAAIVAAVDQADLQVTGFRVLYCEIDDPGVQYLDDPDPLTKHVAVPVRVQTEPA